MKYDLSNTYDRKRFVRRANQLLKKKAGLINLLDESGRTLNQNSYLHVLIRIMALETGVSESYAKQVYFKIMSNPDLFISEETDNLTGAKVQRLKSTSELKKDDTTKAINNFRHWAENNGYYLPEASLDETDHLVFKTKDDEDAFKKAEIETGKAELLMAMPQ